MKKSSYLGHSNWKDVFKKRNAFSLTKKYLDVWEKQNKSYYRFVSKYIPLKKKMKTRILELGCGPARHAIIMANMGYDVTCIDIDDDILIQAKRNSDKLCKGIIRFLKHDIYQIYKLFKPHSFEGITHGGLMEHFDSEKAIQMSLYNQLTIAPRIVFDIPLKTKKNELLFTHDTIFRHIWTSKYWITKVIKPFTVLEYSVEIHDKKGMTDDLICAIKE